jgi:hypothetical protein
MFGDMAYIKGRARSMNTLMKPLKALHSFCVNVMFSFLTGVEQGSSLVAERVVGSRKSPVIIDMSSPRGAEGVSAGLVASRVVDLLQAPCIMAGVA